MFFDTWMGLVRVVVIGFLAYVALIMLLRVSGRRPLSKMNAFDLAVTVALGSTLATILLSETVALAEGVMAFTVLIGLQFAITRLSVRRSWVSHMVKAEPTLLFYHGRFLHGALKQQRVIEAEVFTAIRAQGAPSVAAVAAVVLETDSSFTVLERTSSAPTALATVEIPEQHAS